MRSHLDDVIHHLRWGKQNRWCEGSNLSDTTEEERRVEAGKDQTDSGFNHLMPAARHQSIVKQSHLQVMLSYLQK